MTPTHLPPESKVWALPDRPEGDEVRAIITLDHVLAPASCDNLALAMVKASPAPTLLLDTNLTILAASDIFLVRFKMVAERVTGRALPALGQGEWLSPALIVSLLATASSGAAMDAYEMDLIQAGRPTRRLVIDARKLDYGSNAPVRVVLTITDVTAARGIERLNTSLLADKAVLMQELQHRVANSLQIIASVILQSARQVDSEDGRRHLRAAHSRVMSVAELQRFLATEATHEVALAAYFTQLAASLTDSMIQDAEHLAVNVDVDDSRVPPETAMSLGLLVTELVINALKHAFAPECSGTITIGYRSDTSGWALQVQDDGVGMACGSAAAEPGLGTSIIRALAGQLGARVLVSDNAPGTCVRIRRDAQDPPPPRLAI